jgi:hypothetical protein
MGQSRTLHDQQRDQGQEAEEYMPVDLIRPPQAKVRLG